MSFEQSVADCDLGAAEKSRHQLAHPEPANHKVKHASQLVFTDLIGSLTTVVLRAGYKYVNKVRQQDLRRANQVNGDLFADF